MTGAFLFFWPIKFFKLYSFSFTHFPTPHQKIQPQKPETGQNDGI